MAVNPTTTSCAMSLSFNLCITLNDYGNKSLSMWCENCSKKLYNDWVYRPVFCLSDSVHNDTLIIRS